MELYWIWLSLLEGISIKQRLLALDALGSPKEVYYASTEKLCTISGLKEKSIHALREIDLIRAKRVQNECYEKNISLLPFDHPLYPETLRNIPDPPLLLYYCGRFPMLNDELVVSVVGTRKASENGRMNARRLGYEMSMSGVVVVSGAAAGIDAAALEGALHGKKPVIAVLGCGVDVVYPKSSRRLLEDIRDFGCVISEYTPGTQPDRFNFPARNRIISGLSRAVLVVEAPRKSGALITAKLALDQGRDVYAVPGNAGLKVCAGSNDLLRQGAMIAEFGSDLIGNYEYLFRDRVTLMDPEESLRYADILPPYQDGAETPIAASPVLQPQIGNNFEVDIPNTPNYIDVNQASIGLPDAEQTVLKMIGGEPTQTDTIIETLDLPAQEVLSALTMLEVRKLIRSLPGGSYVLAFREEDKLGGI